VRLVNKRYQIENGTLISKSYGEGFSLFPNIWVSARLSPNEIASDEWEVSNPYKLTWPEAKTFAKKGGDIMPEGGGSWFHWQKGQLVNSNNQVELISVTDFDGMWHRKGDN